MPARRGSVVDTFMENVSEEGGHVPWYKKVVLEEASLGAKTIGWGGSIVLLVNNITGPGMLLLPVLFQQAGWLVPMATLTAVCAISSLSCCCLADAMSRMEGNSRFDQRAEFYNVFHYYFGETWAAFFQLLLCFCLTSLNCACIIGQAQVTDSMISHFHGTTYGLQLWEGSKLGSPWSVVESPKGFAADGDGANPILTAGYVGTMFMVMPLGFCNLDENIIVQASRELVCVSYCITRLGFTSTLPDVRGSDASFGSCVCGGVAADCIILRDASRSHGLPMVFHLGSAGTPPSG